MRKLMILLMIFLSILLIGDYYFLEHSGRTIHQILTASTDLDKEKVVSTYGDDYYTTIKHDGIIIGYVDKMNELSIEFIISDDEVSMITFDNCYTN